MTDLDEALRNGVGPVQVPVGNPGVIRVLEEALVNAKEGRVAGVAVICALGPEALNLQSGGGFPVTLAGGCAQMQNDLLDATFKPQKRSPILRPGRA